MLREPTTSWKFLSTLSLRRATVTVLGIQHRVGISIHALLAESDSRPRSLKSRRIVFLSTLSLRRATAAWFSSPALSVYFYPRSPCGERPAVKNKRAGYGQFLSTLSLRRATISSWGKLAKYPLFLSTLSLRRATTLSFDAQNRHLTFLSTLSLRRATGSLRGITSSRAISIHALLAESDYLGAGKSCNVRHFYPRSPCGERP